MTITDDMIAMAIEAYEPADEDEYHSGRMLAALEAVAPMLIARGFNEALELAEEYEDLGVDDYERAMNQLINTLRVRAQEIDPK